jgi:uncharacterized protein YndB with AHSA1/START domain
MYPGIRAEHCTHTYTQRINAPPTTVFPLLCPMREQEWIPGWRARMIHSNSGVAEAGALFATASEAGATLWIVTAYEPPHRIQFARFQADGVVVLIDIAVAPDADQRAFVHIRYSLTASTADAAEAVRAFTQEHWQRMMTQWQDLMNGFIAEHATRSR